jgi:hypothetical protein
MKPAHIVVLILAGALGGAGIMRMVQRPKAAPAAAVEIAQTRTPAPEPAAAPAPPVQQQPETPETPAAQAPAAQQPEPPAQPPARRTPPAFRPRLPVRQRALAPINASKPSPFAPAQPAQASRAQTEVAQPPTVVSETVPVSQAAEAPKEAPATGSPLPARPQQENATPAAAPESAAPTVTLSAGTLIPVRLLDALSTERNAPGDPFAATLDRELVAVGFVIAERGARVEGRVVASDRGTKTKGGATLSVELTRLYLSDGQVVRIQTDEFVKRMEPDRQQDATKIAGGAIIGAVIGGIAGGGKGAAIGAGAGGGAGAGDVLLTRKPAALASETRMSFRVRTAVTITEHR